MSYRWNIFLVNLDPVIGSEQGKTRPAIIISDEEINKVLPVINILPITSLKKNRKIYPNEVLLKRNKSGLDKNSLILCYQIRTIDKKRLIKQIGKITDKNIQSKIIDALALQLGL